ncbi:hypothetical protein AZF37_05345 [endosymbiont 'TC1' of Trimyema compressum]|nr:hypothetical protein AZF37_05345 [endosymbiont 'TC1' of Trimyema compressum]
MGETNKSDFLIPPFVIFYFYIILASVFRWPLGHLLLFNNTIIAWLGFIISCLGLLLFGYGLISFGKSFRIGIDQLDEGALVTSGAFAFSRNPLYT